MWHKCDKFNNGHNSAGNISNAQKIWDLVIYVDVNSEYTYNQIVHINNILVDIRSQIFN